MRVQAITVLLSFSLAILAAPVPDAEVIHLAVISPGLR